MTPDNKMISRARALADEVSVLIMRDGDRSLAGTVLTLAMARLLAGNMPEKKWRPALERHVEMALGLATFLAERRKDERQ